MSLLNSWRKSNRRRQTNKQEWSIINHFSLDPYLHLCVHMAACCLSKHHRSSVASLSKQTGWHWPGAHSCHKSRGGYVCCKQTHHDSDARRSKLGQVVALESGKIPLLLSYCGLVSKLRLGYKVVYVPSCTHPPPPLPLIVESFNEEIDTICVVDLAYYDIERMILMQLMQVVWIQ